MTIYDFWLCRKIGLEMCDIKGDITGTYSGYHGDTMLMQTTVPYFRQTSIMFLLKHAIY